MFHGHACACRAITRLLPKPLHWHYWSSFSACSFRYHTHIFPRGGNVQDQPEHVRCRPRPCIPTQAANLVGGSYTLMPLTKQQFIWYPSERCPLYGADKPLRISRPAKKVVITQTRLLPFRNASLGCRVHRRGGKLFSR